MLNAVLLLGFVVSSHAHGGKVVPVKLDISWNISLSRISTVDGMVPVRLIYFAIRMQDSSSHVG